MNTDVVLVTSKSVWNLLSSNWSIYPGYPSMDRHNEYQQKLG